MSLTSITKSKETTIAGIAGFLSLAFKQVEYLLDGIDATQADWGMLGGALMILIIGLRARDHNVSSEDAKIKE